MPLVTTVTRKGQITIPIELRRRLGLSIGRKVRVEPSAKDTLLLKPLSSFGSLAGSFPSKKRFSKEAARKHYLKEVLAGKI